MRKIKKTLRLLIVLASLAAIIYAGVQMVQTLGKAKVEYRTEAVERGSIKNVVTANGALNPMVIANVGTQVSGEVTKLYVKVNDEVKKDQLIAEIDPALLQATLKQSKSRLEISRINLEQSARDLRRAKELYAKDYIARIEVERAEQSYLSQKLSYESDMTQVERDEVNLEYTQIRSPIDGIVISKEVTEGQTVASSFQAPTLFRIAGSLVEMKIDVTIPESDIGKLKVGMPVTFTVDAHPDEEFSGELTSININPNSGQLVVTYSAEVTLRNEKKNLLPGMTAYVNIVLSEKPDILKVPAAALRFQPPKEEEESALKALFDPSTRYRRWRSEEQSSAAPTIYLLQGGAPVEVKVATGMMDDQYVEVTSPEIKQGDKVIVGTIEPGV